MTKSLLALAVLLLVSISPTYAQDQLAAKRAAADRYLKAVPTTELLEDMIVEMSSQLTQKEAARFMVTMKKLVDVDKLDSISIDAMVKTFTLDELNALADFYSSKHGVSSLKKMGAYMAEITPAIVQELRRAAESANKPQ